MKHHLYNPGYRFVEEPCEFDKYTERKTLQYCLGATMYMPGTMDFTSAVLNKKYPGLTSMVMCFEDACRDEELALAEENAIHFLDVISGKLEDRDITYADIPLLFFRVRSVEQFERFIHRLHRKHLQVLAGFTFPKFNRIAGEAYFNLLRELNDCYDDIVYGMPIVEDMLVARKETRIEELIGIKELLDRNKPYVLNVRVGAADFSACFGTRRDIEYTIYDILPVRDILVDILNVFTRNSDYIVSGPVWEYFKINEALRFQDIPRINIQESLLRREPLVNAEVDGLMRELILDKANGFVGKTVIHPSHINYVNGMLAVTKEEYDDASQILANPSGVIKSKSSNKMNEIKPHHLWAEKVVSRATVYGVIENKQSYLDLFGNQ